jgi:DNA polymerase III subunit epsilon
LNLQLKKALCFFDLETTGVTIGLDRIVEISVLKVNTENEKKILTQRINPEVPIPAEVSKIHGIYDKDVAEMPTFKEFAPKLSQFIGNSDFAGFNSNKFDIPMLVEEFMRVSFNFEMQGRNFVDVQNIFHLMEPRNLSAAYKFYCSKTLENAHSAEADTVATYEIFLAQLQKYSATTYTDKAGIESTPIVNNIEALAKFTNYNRNVDFAGRIILNDKDQAVFNFGKYKGQAVEEVFKKDLGYYSWMMDGDFAAYTKKVITEIKIKTYNK